MFRQRSVENHDCHRKLYIAFEQKAVPLVFLSIETQIPNLPPAIASHSLLCFDSKSKSSWNGMVVNDLTENMDDTYVEKFHDSL